MSRVLYISALVAAILCILSGGAVAQNPPAPTSCAQATSILFNATEISGVWYEVARNPAPSSFMACIGLNVSVSSDNTSLIVDTTYSNMPSMLYMNQTVTGSLLIPTEANTTGLNVTYSLGSSSYLPTTYKLLATDYNNYAFVCGYTNATDNSTSFGLILTRQRMPSADVLNSFESQAASNFSFNFLNGSMANITQTQDCYINSAVSTVPALTVFFASLYALLQFLS